ncbi:MAG: DsbC family protein [Candidatus Aenigmatarchaeota archaeon]
MKKSIIKVFGILSFTVIVILTLLYVQTAYTEGMAELFKERLKRLVGNEDFSDLTYTKSPVEGVYQVIVKGNVIYMTRDGYIFAGILISPDNENLTQRALSDLRKNLVKNIDLKYAIKIGNGQHQVIEFIDPDCPFCRKVSEYLDKKTNVTRYVFLLPLPIHPQAEPKSMAILCADNPQQAYMDAMKGKEMPAPSEECKNKARPLLDMSKKYGDMLGVRGTPFLIVDNNIIEGANFTELERLLK